ncbi:MAG: glycosyltransferase, partial [Flavobacteriales bacterium]|nr:glycosyltransferase [Flavobacteriales bacterium]
MISILMPVFNAEKFVEQAINSILDQSHTNWELLIYNDGSTDISSDIISHFSDPRIKVW